jgi:fibronectin type III domain protein
MFKKKTKRFRPMKSVRWRKRNVAIVIAVVLSLFAGWTLLAYSGALDPLFRHKGRNAAPVAVQSFNSNSPSKEYVYAGGRLVATEEPGSGGSCTAPSAPGTPVATAQFSPSLSVSVSWPPSSGTVDHYAVERRNNSGSFGVVATTSGTSIADTSSLSPDTTYVYRVRAFADVAGTCPSPYSLVDIATTTNFGVDPTVAQGTTIYAAHLLTLRTAVNAVWATAGFTTPFDWPDSSTPGATVTPAANGAILKEQVQKLRNRLNEARQQLGLPLQPFTNEPLTAGTRVFANHILELRQGVQ